MKRTTSSSSSSSSNMRPCVKKHKAEQQQLALHLHIDEKVLPNWPFRLMEEEGAPFKVIGNNIIEFDPVLHFEMFPDSAPSWLIPWFTPRVEAVCGHKLASAAGYSLAFADWRSDAILKASFLKTSPLETSIEGVTTDLTFEQLTQHTVEFLLRIEDAWREKRLHECLAVAVDKYLSVNLSKGLCTVRPQLKYHDHHDHEQGEHMLFKGELPLEQDIRACFRSDAEREAYLGPGLGLRFNAITGKINGPLVKVSVRGCLLSDSYSFDCIPAVAAYLTTPGRPRAESPSLVVVSKKNFAWWIEALPGVGLVHDDASWMRVSSKTHAIVVVTFEFLLTDAFRLFHTLLSDQRSVRLLSTVFRLCVSKDPALLATLNPEQRSELSSNLFRVDLQSLFRLVGKSVVDAAARLLSAAGHEIDLDADPEFLHLLDSRISLRETWGRVFLENPKRYLYQGFKKENRVRFSAESCGLHRKRLAFGDTMQKSRVFLNFAVACMKGFKVVFEPREFSTFQEVMWCMELLDFRLNGQPWTQIAQDFAGSGGEGLLPSVTREFRQRLFSWASLMGVVEVCALKRALRRPKVINFRLLPIQVSDGEQARLNLADADVNRALAATCLPFIPRERKYDVQQNGVSASASVSCSSCLQPSRWATSCGHGFCLSCLDQWQAARLANSVPDTPVVVSCPSCRGPIQRMVMVMVVVMAVAKHVSGVPADDQICESPLTPALVAKSESGSKVGQLISVLADLGDELLVCLSTHGALLAEAQFQTSQLLPEIRASRFDGGSFLLPCDHVLFSTCADLLQNGADFTRSGFQNMCVLFLEPSESMLDVLEILNSSKSREPLQSVTVFYIPSSHEEVLLSRLNPLKACDLLNSAST